MSQVSSNHDSDGESDSSGYITDEFGEVLSKADVREKERIDKIVEESIRDNARNHERNRLNWYKNENPIAYTIPQEVYDRAWKHPESMTDDDRALILSRGDIQSRALIDAKGLLTQAERYTIISWPSPDVVTENIRAVTKGMNPPLSTPLELVEKAERDGADSLPPKAALLVANKFKAGDEVDVLFGTDKSFDVHALAIPGNREARDLALKAEGLDMAKLGAIMVHHADSTLDGIGRKLAAAQGMPLAPLSLFKTMMSAILMAASLDFEQLFGSEPFEQKLAARRDRTAWLTNTWPQATTKQTTSASDDEREPHIPGSFPPDDDLEPISRPPGKKEPEEAPIESKPGGPVAYAPVYPRKKQFAVPGADETGIPPIPGPSETYMIVDQLADSLLKLKDDHDKGHMNKDEFGEAFNTIVSSMRGLSLRFKLARRVDIDPKVAMEKELRQRGRTYPPAPRLQLKPNPFGLRLTHDGRGLARTPKDAAYGDVPSRAYHMPPWSLWSPDIPHRGMKEPYSIPYPSHEHLVMAINEWTTKEEIAHKKDLAEGREPPKFHETPPLWPANYTPKHDFDIYHESVMDTKEARAWPDGDTDYARTKWEAMTADEQAIYGRLCEERRRLAWLDSMNKYHKRDSYWKKKK